MIFRGGYERRGGGGYQGTPVVGAVIPNGNIYPITVPAEAIYPERENGGWHWWGAEAGRYCLVYRMSSDFSGSLWERNSL